MEVDFGDRELFEQLEEDTPVAKHITFTDDEEAPDNLRELRERLEECDETIGRLKAENEELRRKLNVLSRPIGINVVNSKIDGPLCQILFGNNKISKQYRQDIEDFIFEVIQKHQHQQNDEREGSALHVNPQNSSLVLEEKHKTNDSSTGKHIKDAFSIVGSVLYFTSFCLDKLGQPLLSENPQLTEGWEIPKYPKDFCRYLFWICLVFSVVSVVVVNIYAFQMCIYACPKLLRLPECLQRYPQVFGQVMALEGQEMQIKEKRPKPCCFNCGAEDHQLRVCPKPKDMARISEKRKQFTQGSNQCNQRYHAEEVEERFAKYKPGIVSKELLDALGVVANTLPPFIYRMRELGYPPGWLKEAEMENSGLMLYDGTTSGDGEEDMNGRNQNMSYDVSKLVDFPGFNVSAPSNIRDDYRAFCSIPMQPQHWKHTFAAQLSNLHPTSESKNNKRCHESESTPQQTKKWRSNSDVYGSSDMDTDSDQDAAGRARSDGFRFQTPLPPGSPLISTPPPLPLGTPPVTPTPPPLPKGTPPQTPPQNASPIPQTKCGPGGEESEDGLTLEELEEQQRLLWAALESADNANSDSETGASGTPGRSTPPVSPLAKPGTEQGEEEVKMEYISSHNCEESKTPTSPFEEQVTDVYEDVTSDDAAKDALNEDLSNVGAESCDELIVLDEISQENDYDADKNGLSEATEEMSMQVSDSDKLVLEEEPTNEEPTTPKVMSVPHRSKFAEGIIPFEDTPEFTEVAEGTGVYLKIRDLLKGSPRNQAKNKK